MAIISIPSSIGGVTIPGLATNGPLGALFNNAFGTSNLQYPRDLQSLTRGHYVIFQIRDINPVGYENDTTYTLGGGLLNAGTSAVTSAVNTITNFITGSNSVASSATLTPQTYTDRGTISLYIPETMNFTYNQQYNSVSATAIGAGAAGAVLSGISKLIPESKSAAGKAITSTLSDLPAGDLFKLGLQKEAGLAINPKLQLLFEGINFREYQMAFTFTPYSQQEADTVNQIIKTFKMYAAPRIVKGAGGMFFIPPAVFQPTFYFNGQVNDKVNAVTESVITNIDVNYGPNGWATFSDGNPVQTTLTLQFQETKILDRGTMVEGNY